jgi:hypothetical protein
MRPLFEHAVSRDRIFYSGDDADLGAIVIACKQESELIQAVDIVGKDTAEVLARRILSRFVFRLQIFPEASHELTS